MPTTVAKSLIEALPYVKQWAGKTIVVKIGGSALTRKEVTETIAEDMVLLNAVGIHVVLVHGGGAAVSDMGRKLGLEPKFIDGLRVTDAATMRIAQMVQVGGISRDFVAAIAKKQGRAIALSGADGGGCLKATPGTHHSSTTGEVVDLGRVGKISSVDANLLQRVMTGGFIPVIAPVAVDESMEAINVNADTVATAIAAALGAAKLIFLSDVDGIKGPDGQVASTLTPDTLQQWMKNGTISGGMIPKAQGILEAIEAGVDRVTVANGQSPHAILVELLTRAGVGSMIVSAPESQT
jgi:acetylglutamate kinase